MSYVDEYNERAFDVWKRMFAAYWQQNGPLSLDDPEVNRAMVALMVTAPFRGCERMYTKQVLGSVPIYFFIEDDGSTKHLT